MNKIICKKCGTEIDISQGECPVCGAMYYIIPEQKEAPASIIPVEPSEATKILDVEHIKKTTPNIADDETKILPNNPRKSQDKQSSTRKRFIAGVKIKPLLSERNISKQWLFAVGASAFFAILTVIICLMAGVFDFGSDDTTMPDVLGLAQNVAVNELKAYGVSANIIYVTSAEDEGTVIEQSPAQGTDISEKTTATLTVSMGTADETPAVELSVTVPDVMGKSYTAALRELEALGLTVVVLEAEYSASAEEDCVTRQSPLSGSKVTEGATISLTLSLGEAPKEYRISLSASTGGSISPEGTEQVEEGDSLTITATADEGYELTSLRINGEDMGAKSTYKISNIEENYSAYAVFTKIPEPEPTPEPEPDETPEPSATTRPSSSTDIN